MIKVSISNLDGKVTNQATFKDQPAVDAWVSAQVAQKAFGKNERWVYEDDLSALGEDKTKAIASQDVSVGSSGETKKQYKFPADYTISQSDVTLEIGHNAAVARGVKAQELGAQVIAAVYSINEASNITSDQLHALMADPQLALIERLCFNGSIVSARALIAALPNTFFTGQQVSQILALLDSYIAELAAFQDQYVANQSNG